MLESDIIPNAEKIMKTKLGNLFITVFVIVVMGVLPIIPIIYSPVIENPGPPIDVLASFFQMIGYILFPLSGITYSFTPGSLIAVAILLVVGWLLRRFLLRKFIYKNKDQTHAQN